MCKHSLLFLRALCTHYVFVCCAYFLMIFFFVGLDFWCTVLFSLLLRFPNCVISINTMAIKALLILTLRKPADELQHDGQICNQKPQIHQEATCHLEHLLLNCRNPRAWQGQSIATHHQGEISSQKYRARALLFSRIIPFLSADEPTRGSHRTHRHRGRTTFLAARFN